MNNGAPRGAFVIILKRADFKVNSEQILKTKNADHNIRK